MPIINVRGPAAGAGGPKGVKAGLDPLGPPTQLDNARITMSPADRSKAEMGLRKMARDYDQYLITEAKKTEAELTATALRGAAARQSAEVKSAAAAAQGKLQKDREYQSLWKGLLNDRDRTERQTQAQRARDIKLQSAKEGRELRDRTRADLLAQREAQKVEQGLAAERTKTQRTAAVEAAKSQREANRKKAESDRDYVAWWKRELGDKDRTEKEARRKQQAEEREEARKAAHEERQSAHIRRENIKAFGFGAVAGGVIGGAAAGDLGGVLGAVGGGLGGGLGSMIGNAIAPGIGGIVGRAIGAAVGSLAGVAVNPYSKVYQATKPYLNFQEDAYALGRLRGQSGLQMDRGLLNRSPAPFKFLQDVGMGPDDAAKALLSLGYVPQGDFRKTVTTIGTLANKTQAFAGLGQDAVTGLLGRAGAYGINSANETGTGRAQSTIDMLSAAVAQGFDHSRLLDSVESSLDTLVQQSGRADLEGITKLVTQTMATGLPGGITGATAKDVVSASASMGENILQNPMTSAGLTLLAAKKYNNLKTAQDVARFAGVSSPDQIDPTMMQDILSAANSGRLNTALRLASSPAVQAAGHLQTLGTESFPLTGLPADTRSIYAGNFTGLSLSASQGYNSSLRFGNMNATDIGIMRYNGNNPGYANSVENWYSRMFGGKATSQFDPKIGKKGYLKQLLAKGIDPEVARDLVDSSAKRGLNPLLLASVGMQESHLNKNQGAGPMNRNGTFDSGIMQINSIWKKTHPEAFTSLAGNIDVGAQWLATTLKKSGGFGDAGGSAVPMEALRGRAYSQQGDINEALLSLKTLEPAARTFADAVGKFEKAVDRLMNNGVAGGNGITNNPKALTKSDSTFAERFFRGMMTHTMAP